MIDMLRKTLFFSALVPLLAGIFWFTAPSEAFAISGASKLSEPVLLPTSPFYFLKEWRRGILRSFTRDPLSQIVLEMDILDEKASELRKIQEVRPDDEAAIQRSLDGYKTAQSDLKKRLESISSIRTERERDVLTKELFNRLAFHNKFFETLSKQYTENSELTEKFDSARENIAGSAVTASENISEEKLRVILRGILTPTSTASSTDFTTEIEIMERMKGLASGSLKKSIEEIEREFFFSTSSIPLTASSTATSTPPNSGGKVCSTLFDPVCGKDGKTYSNSCFAEAIGIREFTKGECGRGQ
jgi:antitoxin component HigA of HigAB toxin-antitoxin module